MKDCANVPVRDAATVVLLRDGRHGLETFLLRRNRATVFGPGHYVFPGGAVDVADADPAVLDRCDGLDDNQAARRLGVAQGGLRFWIAAVRECFEECGLLLATDARGRDLGSEQEFAGERAALNVGRLSFAELCRKADLRLPVNRLLYYTHWTTPPGAPRRYATRFFACSAPTSHASAVHDGSETVAGDWETPAAALAAFEQGDYPMMPPTVAQLLFLADCSTVDAALAALAAVDVVERGPRLPADLSEGWQ